MNQMRRQWFRFIAAGCGWKIESKGWFDGTYVFDYWRDEEKERGESISSRNMLGGRDGGVFVSHAGRRGMQRSFRTIGTEIGFVTRSSRSTGRFGPLKCVNDPVVSSVVGEWWLAGRCCKCLVAYVVTVSEEVLAKHYPTRRYAVVRMANRIK